MMNYKNILIAFLFPVVVQASTSLKDAVEDTLLNNPDILSHQKNNKAYRLYIDEAKGAYLPTVDLELSYEDEKTIEKEPNTSDVDEGPKTILNVKQKLYDGGRTYNTVLEKKYDYNENYLKNKKKTEDIVLDVVNVYLDLKQAHEITFLAKENIAEHERILTIAKENEEISGEAIDRLQAESKLYSAFNILKDQEQSNKLALSEYKKIVGNEPNEEVCRPVLFDELLPKNVDDGVLTSLQKNLEIKAQLQAIFKQRAIFSQEKSRFLPTIDASFQYAKDKDVTTDDTTSTVYTSSITLSYNLFNGTQDIASYEREKIFLFESQKQLDSTTKSIEDSVKQAFTSYMISQKKLENLKKYAELKKEILSIYIDQFEGGTVSILDLLSEASELFRARQELIQEEISQLKNYFTILALYGDLSDVILDNTKQVCSDHKTEGLFTFANNDEQLELDAELEDLLGGDSSEESDLGLGDESDEDGELGGLLEESNNENLEDFEQGEIQEAKTNDEIVNEMLQRLLAEAYKNDEKDYLVIDDDSVKTKPKVIGNESFKDKFLKASPEHYTINVIAFGSMEKASQFIKNNSMINNSFAFQYGKDLSLFKVVYGVFENYMQAKDRLDMLGFPSEYYPIIEKIGKKQDLYKKYNIDYEVPEESMEDEEPIVMEDEEPIVKIEYAPLPNNIDFKNSFLNADDKHFTINLYTFISEEKAIDFVDQNNLENNTLLFRFGKNRRLIKLIYGIYPTINDANKDIAKLKKIDGNLFPVVEKLKKQKNIYKKFNEPATDKKVEKSVKKSDDSRLLASSPKSYTINIATITSSQNANIFVKRYNLNDDAIVYEFGSKTKYSKVLYGIYDTYEKAVSAMGKLDSDILSNKPHIEKIKKHQELYKKYNKE